jgi:hypothetical protein
MNEFVYFKKYSIQSERGGFGSMHSLQQIPMQDLVLADDCAHLAAVACLLAKGKFHAISSEF